MWSYFPQKSDVWVESRLKAELTASFFLSSVNGIWREQLTSMISLVNVLTSKKFPITLSRSGDFTGWVSSTDCNFLHNTALKHTIRIFSFFLCSRMELAKDSAFSSNSIVLPLPAGPLIHNLGG